jgi:hypothetical protein
MHPSCLEPRMASPGPERLTSIPVSKLDAALHSYHKERRAIIEDRINSKLAANMGGRPKSFRHFVRWAWASLRLQTPRYEAFRW